MKIDPRTNILLPLVCEKALHKVHKMDALECLEHTVNEIDAIEAIYADSGCIDSYQFSVVSTEELNYARALLDQSTTGECPALQIEIRIKTSLVGKDEKRDAAMRCRFPPGYPERPMVVTISCEGLKRSEKEEISTILNKRASCFAGQEAVMDLLEDFKDLMQKYQDEPSGPIEPSEGHESVQPDPCYGRRWIWVHHIKDIDRRKSIVAEASCRNLGGFLKSGYPGIIIVEGHSSDCDDFVTWVKGNKSRPGGFGRNWGHHVRGHVDINTVEERKFTNQFQEMDDMAELGNECKKRGAETEFLEFVMQHRG